MSSPIRVDPSGEIRVRVVMAGASGAGKTSLVSQYLDQTFNPSMPTSIGVDFRTKTLHLTSGRRTKAQVWDTAGQERFRFIAASYWRGADGMVFVFDVTDMASFLQVESWASEAAKHGKPGVAKVLVGNKTDLGYKRTVSRHDAEMLAGRLDMRYFETSAKTGNNVSEMFREVIEVAADRVLITPPQPQVTVTPKNTEKDARNHCWCAIL